jgi:transposase
LALPSLWPTLRFICPAWFPAPPRVSLDPFSTTGDFLDMTIAQELEAKILRYHHVEKWYIGTIAAQLGVHRSTVQRVLAQAGLPVRNVQPRASAVDPYLPFIRETLEKFPRLTASRLHVMVRERGYSGGPDHFRHLIALHRPRPKAEAYLRLRTLPGEQAQVDWGHFGHLTLGRARRPLMAFVMVLSYSRRIFLRFYLDARMENFLRGHVAAFEAFGGVDRVLLYDNLKSAVLERQGEAIHFHPTLLALSGHYRFEPRPVAVARGNEKGRVERAIRYVRAHFFAARSYQDLADLNAQADAWCLGSAADRPWPEDRSRRVGEVFAEEQSRLIGLPENPFPAEERTEVKAGKTPYVRFDLNDYSIPHTRVRRLLTVVADPDQVRVLDGLEVIARHPRSYDRSAQIEDPAHIEGLVIDKREARQHRETDRLAQAVPASRRLLTEAAERGHRLGAITRELLDLLERYGSDELNAAIEAALERGVPHPNAVRLALEQRREARQLPPPVAVALSPTAQQRDVPVRPHDLDGYDQLMEGRDSSDVLRWEEDGHD